MKLATCALSLAVMSCSATPTLEDVVRRGDGPSGQHSYAAVPECAAEEIEANWKERLAQLYVFVEHRGDYRRLGDSMRRLMAWARASGIQASGAPFALFFDDPGQVPVSELHARACLPVAEAPATLGSGVSVDVLARSMVVYARIPGAYPSVARAYPALFAYLRELGWQQGGPIREVYLVDPVDVRNHDELLTEVQIPWVAGR